MYNKYTPYGKGVISMENKLRIGLVGIGGMGNLHIDCYAGMPDVEIVGLCDIVEGRAEAARKAHNLSEAVITCTDFHELITRDDIDAIDIATPNYMHPVIAIAAMKAGKHVFSEKPDCITVEQAEEMKTTSEQTGKVLMVMRNNRWYEPSKYIKTFINEGKAGEIYSGRCGWIRRRGIPGKGGWFTTKSQSGGGPLIDLGVHMIDLSIWLMGNPRPVAVSGCTYMKFAENDAKSDSIHSQFGEAKSDGTFDVEDLAMGFIRFDNGACLQIEFSWASNIEKEEKFVELRGTKAGFSWRDETKLSIYTENEKGECYDINPPFEGVNGHGRNLRHFIDVILYGTEPDFIPQQGVNMIKILNAIYESAKTGREILL